MATESKNFEDIITSKLFKFVIGEEKTEFTIHGGALSRLSKPLERLLNGEMKEATEGVVVWEDMGKSTFTRFIEWAYADKYSTPEPDIVLGAANIAMPDGTRWAAGKKELPPIVEDYPGAMAGMTATSEDLEENPQSLAAQHFMAGSFPCTTCHRDTQFLSNHHLCVCYSCGNRADRRRCNYCHHFPFNDSVCTGCEREYGLRATFQRDGRMRMLERFAAKKNYAVEDAFIPRRNREACEDYTEVFLAHARLYVLADKYDIRSLGEFALYRLWATLMEFTPYAARMGDIAALVSYAFGALADVADGDKMCGMLVHYCACVHDQFLHCDEFEGLMQRFPLFACALMRNLAEGIN